MVIVVTIAVLLRYGKFPKKIMPVVGGVCWGVLAFFVGGLIVHVLDFGQAFTQLLIPACCIGIAYPALAGQRARRYLMIFLVIALFTLGVQFSLLARSSRYTGNPSEVNHDVHGWERSYREQIEMSFLLKLRTTPRLGEQSYPAAPLLSSTAWQLLDKADRDHFSHQLTIPYYTKEYTTYRLWHTALTGLYGKRGYPVQLWYPGGKLKDGIDRMEYRRVGGASAVVP